MPCMDGYSEEYEANRRIKVIDDLTAMLCEACTILEQVYEVPKSIQPWWEHHKEEDKKREEQEKLQKKHTIARLKKQIEDCQKELKDLGG